MTSTTKPAPQTKPTTNKTKATTETDRNAWRNNSYHTRKYKPKRLKKNEIPIQIRHLYVPDAECPDCKDRGNIINDPKAGALVCNQCGLVVEKQLISDDSEWRTFADSDKNGPDPNRVGQAQHYLLSNDGDLSTMIARSDDKSLNALQNQTAGGGNVKLRRGITECGRLCQKTNLTTQVKNSASELFKDLTGFKEFKGKTSAAMATCCVYICAKAFHCDRPLKELCLEFGVNKAMVKKIHSEVFKLKARGKIKLNQKKGRGLQRKSTAEIFAIRNAKELKLNAISIKNISRCIRTIEEKSYLAGKNPQTIAGATIYFVTHCCKDESEQRSYKEIAAEAHISATTIQNAFKNSLYQHRMSLIPNDVTQRFNKKKLVSNRNKDKNSNESKDQNKTEFWDLLKVQYLKRK